MGFDLGQPPLENLIREYASIREIEYIALTNTFWPKINDLRERYDEATFATLTEALEQQIEAQKEAYLTQHRQRLVSEFLSAMRGVLAEMRNKQ